MPYPTYTNLNRSQAGYDRTHNLQFWGIYHLPFGSGQHWANQGIASAIFGGFQISGQLSHVSGAPLYGQPVVFDHQRKRHDGVCTNSSLRTISSAATTALQAIPRFPEARRGSIQLSFANPVEPQYTNPAAAGYVNCSVPSWPSPVLGNTRRNMFRGPGVTNVNASLFRSFKIYHESEFQVRLEAFNVANHAELPSNPNLTVGGGTFGYITSFALGNNAGVTRTLQFSGRINF